MLLVGVIVALLAPAAVVYALLRLPVLIRWVRGLVDRAFPPPPPPLGPPIERIAADLHRIGGRLDDLVAAGPIPGRILRMRATWTAYDDKLLLACAALDVQPANTHIPMSSAERLQTEATLVAAGLVW